jgi:FMN phosphatase YigB (HAD superfamily)
MEGKYFIFDMDETLAELYPMYYFVASLRLKELIEEDNKATIEPISESLSHSLGKAYSTFIADILKEEISNRPLGILRPGVLNVMKQLYELQKIGKIKYVIIYSNNGHLQSLEFIRDLIHEYLGTTQLIKECIHWAHPMRTEERFMRAGAANKTWNVLKNIMVEGNCKAAAQIQPSDIYFFDDLEHKDLQDNLAGNYYKVPRYDFKASFERIAEIYQNAIVNANVNMVEFMDYMIELFVNTANNYRQINEDELASILRIFRSKTTGTSSVDTLPPPEDAGIMMMMNAIRKVSGRRGGKRYRLVNTRKKKIRRRRILTTKKN